MALGIGSNSDSEIEDELVTNELDSSYYNVGLNAFRPKSRPPGKCPKCGKKADWVCWRDVDDRLETWQSKCCLVTISISTAATEEAHHGTDM